MPAPTKRLEKCLNKGLVSILVFLFFIFWAPRKTFAVTFDIGPNDTSSLINAIDQANANGEQDTINLSPNSIYELATANNNSYSKTGLPLIVSEITINGNDSQLLRDSLENFRVLSVISPGSLTINNLIITGGYDSDTSDDYGGGAIFNLGGNLIINDSEIFNNRADVGGGGGIWQGGNSSVTISNSKIHDNSVDHDGSGGGLLKRGPGLTELVNNEITENYANNNGGAIYLGNDLFGGIGGGLVSVENSEISNNSARNYGGGIFNYSGQIDFISNQLINNTATLDGGFLYNLNVAEITNSCISGNSGTALENLGSHVNATNNFWGTANGPSGNGPGSGDSVSGNITFIPFLTSCSLDIPEAKIPLVLLPGLGASWDSTAMLTGEPSIDWKLTPFVKVYDNFKNTFVENGGYVEGQDYFEYYYDWRKPLDALVDQFKTYLETVVLAGKPEGTKINLVGHSLGGLLAKAYAQKYGLDKVNKIVTVGSPHQGAVTAWQVWTGAEQGDKLSWGWLALELYLQLQKGKYASPVDAVHGLTPSVNNLMPTFDFAKKDNIVIPVNTMFDFNNYLNDLKNNLTVEVKNLLVTIAGREDNPDKDTRRWVNLTDRSLADKLLGKWVDGKPESYESIPEGDFTVLELSALVDGATGSTTVTSEHAGLLASQAGIQAVLDSLDLSDIDPSTEIASPVRNPALVFLLHSPAQIKVTTPDGGHAGYGVTTPISNSLYSEADKLLVIYGAGEGDYQIEVVGTDTGDYQLEIGQLTEPKDVWMGLTGQTSNNETDHYQINFDGDNPEEQPLVDPTGKTQVSMAGLIFKQIRDQINQLNWTKTTMPYKNPVINHLDKIDRSINADLIMIDAGNYSQAEKYTYLLILDAYYLRQKLDLMAEKINLADSVRTDLKNQSHEAGQLLVDAYPGIFNQSGAKLNLRMVNNHLAASQKINAARAENLTTVSDNVFAGDAYNLSLEMLNQAAEVINSSLPEAWMKSVVSRLLSLEANKLID